MEPATTYDEVALRSNVDKSSVSKKMLWAGRVLSAIPALMLLLSGLMKVARLPAVTEGFAKLGYPDNVAVAIGIVELACAIFYIIPATAVLGAILVTGYLGGATATHVRVGDPYIAPVIIGVVAWLGLYLRDPQLRALVPLRKPTPAVSGNYPISKSTE